MSGVTIGCQNVSNKRYGTSSIRGGCGLYHVAESQRLRRPLRVTLTRGEPVIVGDTHRAISRRHLQQVSSLFTNENSENSNYDVSDTGNFEARQQSFKLGPFNALKEH